MRVALHIRLKLGPRRRTRQPTGGSPLGADDPAARAGPHLGAAEPPNDGDMSGPWEAIHGAIDRLEHLVERQRQFAYDASHQLRTPLTALRIQLEEALLYPDDTDPRAAVAGALRGAERLQAVVDDLLLSAQPVPPETALPESVDLSGLVAAETARRSPTRISTDVEREITVFGEQTLLARLLSNILDNAERHFHDLIKVRLFRRHGQAVLTVTDERSGVPVVDRSRAFKGFARLDTSRSADSECPGLGLTLARDIAFAHNGTLLTEVSPYGSRFVCRLPETVATLPAAHPKAQR